MTGTGYYGRIRHRKNDRTKRSTSLDKTQDEPCILKDLEGSGMASHSALPPPCSLHFVRCISWKKSFYILIITSLFLLQVSHCQKNKISLGPDRFRSEEDFKNFKQASDALLENRNLKLNLRRPPGPRNTQHIGKRLGQLSPLQKLTGALNGDVREVTRQKNKNRNGIGHRSPSNQNKRIPPNNHQRIPNAGTRNIALRQKQPLLTPSGSNRHEIIRNWESYKVKRQNSQQTFPRDVPNLGYRYIDSPDDGQQAVLPPIRRNERIDIDLEAASRPKRPSTYYPNVEREETNNKYFPEIQNDKDEKRRLRPFVNNQGPNSPSLANLLPKFPSFPGSPPIKNDNPRKPPPPKNRVRVDPTIATRQTTTRTPWTTSVS